ncbi:MAG: sigma-70 family RNA polymerase sigma factor [Kofleriaceae bacterium]
MGTPALHAAIEHLRPRLWTICYRMTGRTSDADDLCQETVAKALSRGHQVVNTDPTGWLIRIATTTCLDHLRLETTRRRVTELADWLDTPGLAPGAVADDPERTTILREDVRYAVVVAFQQVSPRQRAALILHDVCDRSLAEVAEALGINTNAAKQLLHRARTAVGEARRRSDVDVPANSEVVDAISRAIEAGSLDDLASLLIEDAWGIVDGGGIVPVAGGPHLGREAIMRRFVNGWRRLDNVAMHTIVHHLNGEPTVIVRVASAPIAVAILQVETRAAGIASLRVDRDPRRLAAFACHP